MKFFWRRAMAPLQFSVLALTPSRTPPRKPTAATRTLASRIPAWLHGGGFSREGTGGHARKHQAHRLSVDVTAPLCTSNGTSRLQAIYDEIRTIAEAEKEASLGADSHVISKVLRLMDELKPENVGLREIDFRRLRHPLCIPVVAGEGFEVAVFVLPRGGELPLHDHPHMAVLSRILFGSLEIQSYDVDEGCTGTSQAAVAATRGGFWATARGSTSADSSTLSFLLTPWSGNLHAFKARAACAVFDVLIPPYDDTRGRQCRYYRVEDTSALADVRQTQGGDGVAAAPDAQARAGKKTGGTAGDAARVLLREVPEPAGLPRWSPYDGPALAL